MEHADKMQSVRCKCQGCGDTDPALGVFWGVDSSRLEWERVPQASEQKKVEGEARGTKGQPSRGLLDEHRHELVWGNLY